MEDRKVNINGKEVDLSGAIPIKMGDMRKLTALGVDLNEFTKKAESKELPDMDQTANLIFHFANKCNSEITQDDIDEMELDDLADIVNKIFDDTKDAKEDPPT